jgi:hypothetical protein
MRFDLHIGEPLHVPILVAAKVRGYRSASGHGRYDDELEAV